LLSKNIYTKFVITVVGNVNTGQVPRALFVRPSSLCRQRLYRNAVFTSGEPSSHNASYWALFGRENKDIDYSNTYFWEIN